MPNVLIDWSTSHVTSPHQRRNPSDLPCDMKVPTCPSLRTAALYDVFAHFYKIDPAKTNGLKSAIDNQHTVTMMPAVPLRQ